MLLTSNKAYTPSQLSRFQDWAGQGDSHLYDNRQG
jgi:hypothetical protein